MNTSIRKVYDNKDIPAVFHDVTLSIDDAGFFGSPHWHRGIEILFIKEGTAETLIDDKIVRETAGDILLVNSDTLHSTRAVTESVVYYCLVISKSECEKFGFSVEDIYIQTKINDRRLFSMIDEIKNEFALENDFYTAVITAKILEIFTILFREYSRKKEIIKQSSSIDAVKKALIFIEANFTKNITLDDVAESAGYSKYHFCRCFNEITKSTVNSYINRLRIDYAASLLAKQRLSVGETAEKCGFSDISYFTKTFKKYTARTPSQYKTNW